MKYASQKKSFFLSIIIIVIVIFIPQIVKAELGDLEVIFSHDPLFQEISILPGDTSNENFTVTNNTGEIKTIGIEFIGTSTHELDEMIYFTIKENDNIIYGGPSDPQTLSDLLNLGEINLTNLPPNSTTTLNIFAEFDFKADNPYQLKASIFDIKVGFIYFEESFNTPIVLGEEIIIEEELPHAKILGVELPVTGSQLLLIFIVALILLTVTIIILRLTITKTKNNN